VGRCASHQSSIKEISYGEEWMRMAAGLAAIFLMSVSGVAMMRSKKRKLAWVYATGFDRG